MEVAKTKKASDFPARERLAKVISRTSKNLYLDFSERTLIGYGTFSVVYSSALYEGDGEEFKFLKNVAVKMLKMKGETESEMDSERNLEIGEEFRGLEPSELNVIQNEMEILRSLTEENLGGDFIVNFIGMIAENFQNSRLILTDLYVLPVDELHRRIDNSFFEPRGFLFPRLVLHICIPIFSALEFLKKHRIVHGDIKPENILLSTNGIPKLIDFGSARRLLEKEDLLNAEGFLGGTLGLLAPEIVRDEDYDYEVDVWSLAMTMLKLVKGRSFLRDRMNRDLQDLFTRVGQSDEADDATAQKELYLLLGLTKARFVRRRQGKYPCAEFLRDFVMNLLQLDRNNRPKIDEICAAFRSVIICWRIHLIDSSSNHEIHSNQLIVLTEGFAGEFSYSFGDLQKELTDLIH